MSLEDYFRGKRVLVTGGGRGIGRALVERLHQYEAIVIALSRNPGNLEALKKDCPNITTIAVNIENWDETKEAVEKIGHVDCLINNAGILIPESFLDIRPETFDKIYATNLKSIINISQVVAQKMIRVGKAGSIVNISSIAGRKYLPKLGVYCTTKAALDMLTKAMAVDLSPHKIRVNAINPGFYETDMVAQDYILPTVGTREAFVNAFDSRTPWGSIYCEMDSLVNSILFVASDLSGMTNGAGLVVDGGTICL